MIYLSKTERESPLFLASDLPSVSDYLIIQSLLSLNMDYNFFTLKVARQIASHNVPVSKHRLKKGLHSFYLYRNHFIFTFAPKHYNK